VFLLICINGEVNCQKKFNGYSINPKLGVFGPFSGGGSAAIGGAEFYLIRNKLTLGLDFYHGMWNWNGDVEESLNQFNFMDGIFFETKSSVFRFLIQGGIGILKSTYKSGQNEGWTKYTLGVPLDVEIKCIPTKYFSVGIDLQVNMNTEYPIYMIMASVEFGKLKHP